MSPLLAMRDLTKVSGKKEMGRALTLSVARGVEIRPIALAVTGAGFLLGLLFTFLTFHSMGLFPGALLSFLLALLFPSFFLGIGRGRQARAKRVLRSLESKKLEGKVFFAGSLEPSGLEEARVFYP